MFMQLATEWSCPCATVYNVYRCTRRLAANRIKFSCTCFLVRAHRNSCYFLGNDSDYPKGIFLLKRLRKKILRCRERIERVMKEFLTYGIDPCVVYIVMAIPKWLPRKFHVINDTKNNE